MSEPHTFTDDSLVCFDCEVQWEVGEEPPCSDPEHRHHRLGDVAHIDEVTPDRAGLLAGLARALYEAEDTGGGIDTMHTHPLKFEMPRCSRHFFKGHKWWCRRCDEATEAEMREVVHALWELQGAGDRIVR